MTARSHHYQAICWAGVLYAVLLMSASIIPGALAQGMPQTILSPNSGANPNTSNSVAPAAVDNTVTPAKSTTQGSSASETVTTTTAEKTSPPAMTQDDLGPPSGRIYGDVELDLDVLPVPIEPPHLITGVLRKSDTYPIDLNTVINLVKNNNLIYAQSSINRKIQKNRYQKSVTELLPDFQGSYSKSKFQGGIQIFGSQVLQFTRRSIEPRVDATLRAHPAVVLQALAARQRSKSSKALLEETYQEQLSAAVREFFALQEAYIQQNNIRTTITEARSQVTLNDARLKAGVGTKLELMQSKSFLSQQERALIDAENTLAQAEQALLNRLNLSSRIHLTLSPFQPLKSNLIDKSLGSDTLIDWAVDHHPSVDTLDREVKALKREVWTEASKYIPAVDLQAYLSWPGPSHESLVYSRFRGFQISTQFGDNAGLGLPLDIRQKTLLLKQKRLEQDTLVRNIESQVTSAFLNSVAFEKAIDVAQDELATARESARLSMGRYKVGLGVFLDVLNANTALSQARTKMAAAILGYNRAQIQLLEALGAVSPQHITNGFTPDET